MADKHVKELKKASTYLERIPFAGQFFKAARENVTGRGPGTNVMSTPAEKLPSRMKASKEMAGSKNKRASDEMKRKR